jgi:SAM-dependent methyltransferase
MVELRQPIGGAYTTQVRVRGSGFNRLDGMTDLYFRAKDATVFDIGCNRGCVSYDMALAGARRVDGCDIYPDGVNTARELFADLRDVKSRFEVLRPDPRAQGAQSVRGPPVRHHPVPGDLPQAEAGHGAGRASPS